MKLTKEKIEKMAKEILEFLIKKEMAYDVLLFFNDKFMCYKRDWRRPEVAPWLITKTDVDPHDYCKYFPDDHIFSMSFEGDFYDCVNYTGKYMTQFKNILKRYGLYYELCDSWHLTVFPYLDDLEVEYTVYEKEPEPIYLHLWDDEHVPAELYDIMNKWHRLSEDEGDKGSCVLGAGFDFVWRGQKYHMPACSPWQGSMSWEPFVNTVKNMLQEIGAEEIIYNVGRMD